MKPESSLAPWWGTTLGWPGGFKGRFGVKKMGGETVEFQDGDGLGVMMVKII